MVRLYIKDFDIKKQAYKLGVLHHSGMVVDFDVPLAAPMKEIVEKINQAVAFSEVNMAMAFYTGDEVKDGKELVSEACLAPQEEDQSIHQGNEAVSQIETGDSGIQSANGVRDKA